MQAIVEVAEQFGFDAIIIAMLLYQLFGLQKKLFGVIENNTRAMVELQNTIQTFIRR